MTAAVFAEDRRLIILQALLEVPGFTLNEDTLRRVLEHFGHRVGGDIVRADMAWLGEHQLISVSFLGTARGEVWLGRLLSAGEDTARGRHHPGVARAAAPRA